ILNQNMCRISSFLVNLPSEILINILSRLPIQTILSCKCVNKQLLCLLSTPEFAASHLPLSTTGLLILHHCKYKKTSCQVFEFEDELGLQNSNLHSSAVRKFDLSVSMGLPNYCLGVAGSVDGLLCLHESGYRGYDALYICNPMTREYIALPRIEDNPENSEIFEYIFEYGFGVSKISGQYKVVRYVHFHSDDSEEGPCSAIRYFECLVYTVGTRSWRKVQPGAPFFSLFLNGNLHGCVLDSLRSAVKSIYCFDLESESFKPFPHIPPAQDGAPVAGNLGILDDCLCFLEKRSADEGICALWVMKEYGVDKSWTEILVISEVEDFQFFIDDTVIIYPIKAFENGELLLSWNNVNPFYLNSVTKTYRYLGLGIQNEQCSTCEDEAIPHRLSLLSLKNFDGEKVLSFSS
ncbi:F-box protein-like, partial [Dorcoceras hygrometricum]